MLSEDKIKEVLRRLGVNTFSCGYSYISHGVLLTLKDEEYLQYITKNLYVDIAHQFHTSTACVERDIRSAVEVIWRTQNNELLPEICGGIPTVKRPSNKQFFKMMYDYFVKTADKGEGRHTGKYSVHFLCDRIGKECPYAKVLYEEAEKLREENRQLKSMLEREGMLG